MADDRITQARWIAVMALTGLSVYLCWLIMEPFLYAMMWAAVLKIMFNPVHSRLLARTRRPGLAALLSVLVVMVVGIIPLTLSARRRTSWPGWARSPRTGQKSSDQPREERDPAAGAGVRPALRRRGPVPDGGSIKSMLSSMSQPV